MTTVRIDYKEFSPSYQEDPSEEFPEGREIVRDYWDIYALIDGPLGTTSGPQRLELSQKAEATDDDIVQALKALWGGQDDWTLAEPV